MSCLDNCYCVYHDLFLYTVRGTRDISIILDYQLRGTIFARMSSTLCVRRSKYT